MEMQFKNEINKLADVAVWADNWIEELKTGLTEEELEDDTGIEEFETVKKVVLESMERHAVYTSALNRDIAEKAAKIELLEKEIEGRKAGYVALKEKMDTEYISIDEHNKIVRQFEEKVKHQRENLDGINKTLEMRNKEIETLVAVKNNKEREIEAHESENARLTERIMDLKEEVKKKEETINTANDAIVNLRKKMASDLEIKNLKEENDKLKKESERLNRYNTNLDTANRNLVTHVALLKTENEKLKKEIDKWESDSSEYETIIQYQELIDGLNKNLSYWKEAFETQATSLAEVRKCNDELVDTLNKSSDRVEELEKQVKYLEKELDKTCACKELDLKGHNRREMALVNELADKNDAIKKLNETIEYCKNQERIRTDKLRATESKVEELHGSIKRLTLHCRAKNSEIEKLKEECKNKNNIIRKAYARYVDEACKGREEIMDECYKNLTKDDTGYLGFKQYTLRALEKKEGNEEEAKEFICNTADIIFYNKKAEEKRKEEETKKELNDKFGVGGIVDEFKDDIPCGEDSIE